MLSRVECSVALGWGSVAAWVGGGLTGWVVGLIGWGVGGTVMLGGIM